MDERAQERWQPSPLACHLPVTDPALDAQTFNMYKLLD
jgi:hypothetical protein